MLETWLTDIGLEMKPSKTRIAHTLQALDEEPAGFDFLGFKVRHYPVGKSMGQTPTPTQVSQLDIPQILANGRARPLAV